MEWLNNENRLKALCSHTPAHAAKWRECRDEKMKPKRYVLQLRSAPQKTAASEGDLVILAIPGQPLRIYYRSARDKREIEFAPDLFESDWGYGPYFHQTFLERRGTWFLLPAVPFPEPVWVDVSEFTNEPNVRLLQTGEIIKIPEGDFVVLSVERHIIRVRREQHADMWCHGGDPPPVQPSTEVPIPIEKLYSPTKHFLIDIKYKRGC